MSQAPPATYPAALNNYSCSRALRLPCHARPRRATAPAPVEDSRPPPDSPSRQRSGKTRPGILLPPRDGRQRCGKAKLLPQTSERLAGGKQANPDRSADRPQPVPGWRQRGSHPELWTPAAHSPRSCTFLEDRRCATVRRGSDTRPRQAA